MKDIKHKMRFSFGHLGHAPGVGLGGTVGVGRGIFSEIQSELVFELLI